MRSRLSLVDLTGWLIAMAGIAAVTLVGRGVQLNPITVGFAFLMVVLASSVRGGTLVGATASVMAAACLNFFFLPPLHTFSIEDPSNWVALAAFLVTSVTVSRLVTSAREQADRADLRRGELETLHGLSIDLFAATNRVSAIGEAAGRALGLLGAREGGLILFNGNRAEQNVLWWNGEKPEDLDELSARLRARNEPLDFPASRGRDVYLPLVIGGETTGALVARGTDASRPALVAASRLVALAVEREQFLETNAHLDAVRESDALKTSLLRAISHDLTTPLTAITIHIEALKRKAMADAELADAVSGIAGETARLRRRIDNLLSMARLEAGNARPRSEPTPPADLFRAVRENLPLVFQSRPVRVHVADDCPDANIDPSLGLEILVNLIENAHRVSPDGAALELVAGRHPFDPSRVRLEVLDRGPGVPAGIADTTGNLLALANSDIAQRGLGLEIARSFAAANGGAIGITARAGGGAVARLDVPAALLPSSQERS